MSLIAFLVGAVVTRVWGNCITSLAGAGSTAAIDVGALAVNAATAFDHADYADADLHYAASFSAAAMAPLSADSEITWTIAGANMTAGKYDIFVEYVMST